MLSILFHFQLRFLTEFDLVVDKFWGGVWGGSDKDNFANQRIFLGAKRAEHRALSLRVMLPAFFEAGSLGGLVLFSVSYCVAQCIFCDVPPE